MEIDHSIVKYIYKTLNEYRKEKYCCDLILESKEQKQFLVHKIVFATNAYFQYKMEKEGLHKSLNIGKINVAISAIQLEIGINYFYTGEVNVTEEDEIRALYETGLLFDIPFLKEYSTNKLIATISIPVALEYWRHSVKYKIETLMKECLKIIADKAQGFFDRFLTRIRNEEFLQIIDNRDELQLAEIDFYRIINKWISLDYDKRKFYIESLLIEKVDYRKIDTDIVKLEILNDELLKFNSKFVAKISEIMNYNSTINLPTDLKQNPPLSSNFVKHFTDIKEPKENREPKETAFSYDDSFNKLNLQNSPTKLPVSLKKESLYLINRDKLEIHEVNFESRNISLKYKNPSVKYNSYSTCNITCNNNECILISGGTDVCHSLKYNKIWNPQSADISIELPNLQRARMEHNVLFLNDKIYACGGVDMSARKSTEIYDFGSSSWIDGPDFVEAKFDFGLTSLDNSLYAIASNYTSVVVERLDPRDSKNKWQKINSGICPHYIHRCIPLSDHTILCTNRTFYSNSIFDTRNCKFGSPIVTRTKNKTFGSCDLFKLDNIIHSYFQDLKSNSVYIYKYDKNKGWIDSEIKLASTIDQFDLISLEN